MPILFVLVTSVGCGRAEPSQVVRTDSAGVQVVHSFGDPRDLPWAADTIGVFGGDADGSGSFYRVRRALIDVDDQGIVYVLDPSLFKVTAYTSEGVALRSWGRQGQGPGELQSPLSVAVDDDGNVLVHEASRGVLVRYAQAGEWIDEQPAPPVMLLSLRHFEAVPEGLLLWDRDPFQGSDERLDKLLLRGPAGEEPLIRGRVSNSSTAHWPACGMIFTTPLPLSPRIRWSEREGRVGVAAWSDFRVDVYERSRFRRRLLVGASVPPLSEDAAVRLLDETGVQGPCNSTASEFVERHGFHERPQMIQELTLGPEGRMWAEFRAEDGDTRIMVFDSSGAVLGVLPQAFPMPLSFLPDGRGVIQLVDSLDVERVGIIDVSDRHTSGTEGG